jgi:branched-subunit amino acid transport protein
MIQSDYFLINLSLLAMGTLFIRGSFIAFSGKFKIKPALIELFTYIPAAILPGLIIPATFFHRGSVEWMGGKERFLILLASSLLCFFVRNTFVVISFGLGLLYILTTT